MTLISPTAAISTLTMVSLIVAVIAIVGVIILKKKG